MTNVNRNKESFITQEDVRRLFDYRDGALFWKTENRNSSIRAGCVRGKGGYVEIRLKGKSYAAHRLIWLWHTGAWPKLYLDHIDRNSANNRIENLRECTQSQNNRNKGSRRGSSSKYLGVWWDSRREKWCADVRIAGKSRKFGRFETEEEAARVRDAAIIKYGIDFAPLNFP